MSTSPAPRSTGSAHLNSTQQMLDELDALMQKMLALPVNELDEEPAAPAKVAVAPPPPSPVVATGGAPVAERAAPGEPPVSPKVPGPLPNVRVDAARTAPQEP